MPERRVLWEAGGANAEPHPIGYVDAMFHGNHWEGEVTGEPRELNELLYFHRAFLCDDILPWWIRYALDSECGGLFPRIQDDGTVVSTDKYIWSQARGLWTFSAACNRIESRQGWLDAANTVWKLLSKHGQEKSERWMFRTDRQGKEIEGPVSIQTDAFAMTGPVEYAQASTAEEPYSWPAGQPTQCSTV